MYSKKKPEGISQFEAMSKVLNIDISEEGLVEWVKDLVMSESAKSERAIRVKFIGFLDKLFGGKFKTNKRKLDISKNTKTTYEDIKFILKCLRSRVSMDQVLPYTISMVDIKNWFEDYATICNTLLDKKPLSSIKALKTGVSVKKFIESNRSNHVFKGRNITISEGKYLDYDTLQSASDSYWKAMEAWVQVTEQNTTYTDKVSEKVSEFLSKKRFGTWNYILLDGPGDDPFVSISWKPYLKDSPELFPKKHIDGKEDTSTESFDIDISEEGIIENFKEKIKRIFDGLNNVRKAFPAVVALEDAIRNVDKIDESKLQDKFPGKYSAYDLGMVLSDIEAIGFENLLLASRWVTNEEDYSYKDIVEFIKKDVVKGASSSFTITMNSNNTLSAKIRESEHTQDSSKWNDKSKLQSILRELVSRSKSAVETIKYELEELEEIIVDKTTGKEETSKAKLVYSSLSFFIDLLKDVSDKIEAQLKQSLIPKK